MHRLTTPRTDYYLADLATELPASPTGPAWTGQAATNLGLHGAVDDEQLRAVLAGRHPYADRPLRSDRATVCGYDLTFSVPKSVSVLYALGGEEVARQVVAAHQDAVRGAVSYMEAHGVMARRGSGEDRMLVPTTGMLAASFTHGVSRNQDPHLHTHVVMANLVHGADGRWSACDQRGLAAHRQATAAMHDAHARVELTARLGVQWSKEGEILGVSPLLMGEFSSRTADIRRHMAERGVHSSGAARVAWAVTRPAKGDGLSYQDMAVQWQRRAGAVGIEALGLETSRPPRSARSVLDEHRFRAVLSMTPDGAARRRDVVAALALAAGQGARSESVEAVTSLWVPPGPRGVGETAHQLRPLVPGDHLLRALGPRPVNATEHGVWRQAALAIEAYRSAWGIRDGVDPLGVGDTGDLASLPTSRLVDHLQTTRHIEQARQRLGWTPPMVLELARHR